MPCTERRAIGPRQRRWSTLFLTCCVALLTACAPPSVSPPAPVTAVVAAPQPADLRAATARSGAAAATGPVRLSAPGPVRSLNELHLQAARRIVAANPHLTYTDTVPEVLLAIPVLTIDLNADGSIKRIDVLRYPRQAKDTTQIAIDAVRRAAPFGDVSSLPRPWRYTETFLFNDDRRFKPRTLNLR